ncbi:MAG: hypothetical protein DMG60_10115 [Acidobacteria bacterium]|nr:MAG: hypothetical protein DMG60_10115 [Acidobacteriota bacterium]
MCSEKVVRPGDLLFDRCRNSRSPAAQKLDHRDASLALRREGRQFPKKDTAQRNHGLSRAIFHRFRQAALFLKMLSGYEL